MRKQSGGSRTNEFASKPDIFATTHMLTKYIDSFFHCVPNFLTRAVPQYVL